MTTIKYDNEYINQFMDRCKSFPRVKVELVEPNVLKVRTEFMYEGYAWIGASEHNINNGCRGVKEYNYALIDSTELLIYFIDEGEDNKRLKEEIKELKAELDEVKRCNKTMDGILLEREEENKRLNDALKDMREEIKDLRKACKLLKDTSHYPKEYQAEAEEYFHHNPKVKEVYFYMITEYEMKDAESGDLMLSQDDAICSVINAEVLTND